MKMPPNRTKTTPEEKRITKVLQELADGTHKYVAAAANANNVPYYKLYG